MVSVPAFQAGYTGSIPVTRSKQLSIRLNSQKQLKKNASAGMAEAFFGST
jgi:hypothetical protein